jgi:hypothetical protein
MGEEIQRWSPKNRAAGVINAVAHADEVIERAARCMSLMGRRYRKYGGPAPAAVKTTLAGAGPRSDRRVISGERRFCE